MTPELFRQIGEALYGAEWHGALSRELGVSHLNVRRWASGNRFVPAGIEAELRRLLGEALEDRRAMLAEIEAAIAAQEESNGLQD